MSKYDDLKALAKQKLIDAASNREQPVGFTNDNYGTTANPTAVNAGIRKALDTDVSSVEDYWDVRRKAAKEAANEQRREANRPIGNKKGGVIRSSASKRADGIATKGKTRGRII